MIAAWMLWSIGAGLLFLVAGLAMERLLNRGRRWVWVAAGAGTVLLPAVRLFAGGGASEGAGTTGAVVALEPLVVTVPGDSMLHSLDDVLLMGWVVVSALLVVVALAGAARFAWRRRGWEHGTLLGRRVLWTRDSGPAVVGLVTSRIVVPEWVAGAGRARQELVLTHEEEHLAAHDVQVRFLAALLLFACPWNPALWVQYHRLGLAVELDCDRRVMDRWPQRRRLYGDLLLRVGTGGRAVPAMAVAALAERKSLLEQRIRKLFSKAPEVRMAQAAFLAFCAILVVGVAVMVPGLAKDEGQPVEELRWDVVPLVHVEEEHPWLETEGLPPLPPAPEKVEVDPSEAPMWTDVDILPALTNKDEVQQLLTQEYPALLRDAGIGGTVIVWFFIDETGGVVKNQIQTSSGHAALDQAALRIASHYEFSPATNKGKAVPVWVSLGIAFETH